MVRPTNRQLRRLLWTADLALGLALAACAAGLWAWPLDAAPADLSRKDSGGTQASDLAAQAEPLDGYAVLWERPLRRPLYDPAPPAAVKVEPPRPRLNLRLVGTIVEPDNCCGFFDVPGQGVQLLRPGDRVDQALIQSVTDDAAVVLFAGEPITLQLQEPK